MSTRSIVGVWTLGLLAAAAAITSVLTSDHTTGEVPTIALAAPTGLAFIASGIVARARRPRNGTGILLILVGFAWFLAALPTAEQSLLFTLGLVFNGLFIGFLAHLLLAFPSGQLTSRLDRVIAGAMYAVVTLLPFTLLLFDEGEISSTACERGNSCPENLLATIPAQTVANVLAVVFGVGAALLSIAVAVQLLRRWRRASPALRSALNPIVLTAGVLIAAFAVQIAASLFSDAVARAVNWALLTAMLALPLAFLYGLLRPRLTASSRRLAAELAEQRRPEEVQDVLRRALRDPALELGYAGPDGYVGIGGEPLQLAGLRSGRALTPIGDGVIVHDASLLDQPELDEVADAARIALERGLSLRSLEESERREIALLGAIPDNVYRASVEGVLLDVHVKQAADGPEALTRPQDMIGRRIEELFPEVADVVVGGIRRAVESGDVITVEYAVETPAGTQYLEERIVKSGDNEAVGIVRDVTQRKRQEHDLRALAEEQAALSRVAVAVATERPEHLFNVVTEETARLFGARWASMVRYDDDAREVVVVGDWHADEDFELKLGSRFPLAGGAITKAKETGRPARIVYQLHEGDPHREMVAAPIVVTGRIWGAATISLPAPDSFPPDAEERLAKFTSLVAVALANAEAREQLAGLAEEQAALARVALAVATERDPQRVFDVVTEAAAGVLGAEGSNLIRFEPGSRDGLVVGEWRAPGAQSHLVGKRLVFDAPTAVGMVRETGKTARLDTPEELGGEAGERIRALGVKSAVAAPIYVGGQLWGAVVVSSRDPGAFLPDAEERLGKFAGLVAVAIANAEAREELSASRARIVRAGDEERRRLERNLHDGAQQRLVALSLSLRLAQARLERDPAGAKAMLEAAADELTLALEELRELARGIHPAILTNSGLPAALEALAARSPVPVELQSVCQERFPPSVEAAAYYVVAESLTNVAKYADANAAQVSVMRRNGLAVVVVEDDGVGGADATRGSGLRGLADRVEALEGRFQIESVPGRGTVVRAEIPVG